MSNLLLTGAGSAGASFTPPTAPPVGGYFAWLASRQIIQGSTSNPANGAIIPNWDSLSDGDVYGGNTTATYDATYLNGLPGVKFNGAGSSFLGTEHFQSGAGHFSFLWVGNYTNLTPFQGLFAIGGTSGGNTGVFVGEDSANVGNEFQFLLSDGFTPIDYLPVDTTKGINIVTYDGTTFNYWKGGGAALISTPIALSLDALPIGLGYTSGVWTGFGNNPEMELFEVLAYKFTLSNAQINSLGAWYSGTGTGAPNTGLTWTPIP